MAIDFMSLTLQDLACDGEGEGEGVIVLVGGSYGHVIGLLPPKVIPAGLLEDGLDVLVGAIGSAWGARRTLP